MTSLHLPCAATRSRVTFLLSSGPVGGVILLLILAPTNLSSLVGMTQGNCQTIIRIFGPRAQSLGWPGITVIVLLGSAIIVLFATDALYEQFTTLVSSCQAALAPACGIAVADRIGLRGKRVNLRGLFESDAGSDYYFRKQINPVAFTALGVGAFVYLTLLNPVTFDSAPIFTFFSASLPTMGAAFIVHLLLTRLVVLRAGWCSYPRVSRCTNSTALLTASHCEYG